MTSATTARQANAQIRRLRAALKDARDMLCDHFGAQDDSVTACDRALTGDVVTELQRIFIADRAAARSSPLYKAMAKNRLCLTVEQQRDMLESAARLDLAPVTGNPFNQL